MVADIIKITLFPVSMSLGAFRETHHSHALSKTYIKNIKINEPAETCVELKRKYNISCKKYRNGIHGKLNTKNTKLLSVII